MATIIRTSFSRILTISRNSSVLSTRLPSVAARTLTIAANRSKRWNAPTECNQTVTSCKRTFGTLGPPKKAIDLEQLKTTILNLCRAHDKIDGTKVNLNIVHDQVSGEQIR